MEEEFIYAGNIKDTSPYSVQKLRVDGRLIGTDIVNQNLDAGTNYVLLDQKEQGELFGIHIVADNPYLTVSIEIDDWRYSTTIAELLMQPDTGRMHSNFYAVKGETPLSGYALVFNPDFPEVYEKRLKVVLSNHIRKTASGSGGILGGSSPLRGKGNSPTPSTLGFVGGIVRNHPLGTKATNVVMTDSIGEINRLGGVGLVFDLFDTPHPNQEAASVNPIKRGIHHPYVGKAGEITLSREDTMDIHTDNGDRTNNLHVFFDDVNTNNDGFSRYNGFGGNQDIYIVEMNNTSGTALLTGASLEVKDRLVFKDEDRFYFPGQIEAIIESIDLPGKFAKNGTALFSQALKLTVAPGLNPAPPSIVMASEGGLYDSTSGYFTLTATAETNPKIHIRTASIKRRKKVSLDG
jgi:hypothetical protein